MSFRESATVVPGADVVVSETPFGFVGLSICYDLRFGELFRALVARGAVLMTIPSAFTAVTGRAHWEILVRARAIESQAFVVAPGQHGEHGDSGLRESHGHSLIVDPWVGSSPRLRTASASRWPSSTSAKSVGSALRSRSPPTGGCRAEAEAGGGRPPLRAAGRTSAACENSPVNRRSGILVGCVCAAWALVSPLQALDPGRAITQYVQNVWRAPGALPHDTVTVILQTRDGYLWVGTVEGLARFDGVRSVVFDKSNTPAIANNWIRALVEDRAGRLWIGTLGGGLVCLEGGKFTRFGAAEGIPGEIVSTLYEDRAGRLWAGTGGEGLFLFQAGRFVRAPGSEALATSNVRSLVEDREGTLWVGTEGGLFRFVDGTARALSSAMGLSSDAILSLATSDSGLWIGTQSGGLKHLAADIVTTYARKRGPAARAHLVARLRPRRQSLDRHRRRWPRAPEPGRHRNLRHTQRTHQRFRLGPP